MSQISLQIVLMVPTNMAIIQPTSMFDLSQEIQGGGLDWYLSTTYACYGLENWLSLICTNIKLS